MKREVLVGHVGVGGNNPLRIQSMTTSPTDDVEQTVNQILHLHDVGCEIARVTVQGKKEALACEAIKNRLLQLGCPIPIVADIHFYPPAALLVADFVDKVRINPGNFADRRATFKVEEYSEAIYARALEKLEEKFVPLVDKLKKQKKALRIGANHGSLSDRILNRFGDTPEGMVESALEYARVARAHDYHNIIFSMKASNTLVMIEAYRLLEAKMGQLGWDYPIHLGVTEAGEGEDGRVKSAIGIGSLLVDGIGDTVRVSLTEDPWLEIDPCQRLSRLSKKNLVNAPLPITHRQGIKHPPLHRDCSVILLRGDGECDLRLSMHPPLLEKVQHHHLFQPVDRVTVGDSGWELLEKVQPQLIFFSPSDRYVERARQFFDWIKGTKIEAPVILHFKRDQVTWDDFVIEASLCLGSLLCDGLGDGILLDAPFSSKQLSALSFNILQGARKRSVKTEFISCPSCGRTLFNLQDVAARIREKTNHLPGVKIAIMGCIVNGPGEMADAHFGYVGSRPGKIDLYVGKECVERDIDDQEADDKLIDLIKKHGMWTEPSSV